jgi:hypothetical protein
LIASVSRSIFLFEQDLFRKIGIHFSGSCSGIRRWVCAPWRASFRLPALLVFRSSPGVKVIQSITIAALGRAEQGRAVFHINQAVRPTLPIEPFDEGSAILYAATPIRCRIFRFAVSQAGLVPPIGRQGLSVRPWFPVKRRIRHSGRLFYGMRSSDLQSL